MADGFRGGPVLRRGTVVSTMDEARGLPPSPAPVVVVAQAQTGGRGRFDRTWVSPAQGGLYLTARIPWSRPLAQSPLVSMGTALALARLCEELGCPGITLKWPNDLLLDHRKAAGILAEMHHPPQSLPQLLVGVGLNVSQPQAILSKVGQPAVSLADACGRKLELEPVLSRFLRIWTEVDEILEFEGFASLVEEYRSRSDLSGRLFRLEGSGERPETVRVDRILDDGTLAVVSVPGGTRRILHGGELLPLP